MPAGWSTKFGWQCRRSEGHERTGLGVALEQGPAYVHKSNRVHAGHLQGSRFRRVLSGSSHNPVCFSQGELMCSIGMSHRLTRRNGFSLILPQATTVALPSRESLAGAGDYAKYLPPKYRPFSWVPVGSLRITAHSASSAVCGAPHTAEFERELIRTRTGEGRDRARASGVKMGRKPKLTPHQVKEALQRREAGEPMRDIARSYNVHNSTISRLV